MINEDKEFYLFAEVSKQIDERTIISRVLEFIRDSDSEDKLHLAFRAGIFYWELHKSEQRMIGKSPKP